MHKAVVVALVTVFSFVGGIGSVAAAPTQAAPETGTGIGQRVPPFTAELLDVSGAKPRSAPFDSHKTKHVTAYIFVGTHCPATQAYVERLAQLQKTYKSKGVDILYIYPNHEDTADMKVAFHKEKKLSGRLIDDQGGKLARLFGAQRTSEVFVTDKKGIIVYHGAIDDSRDPSGVKQHYLTTALDQTLAGKPVLTASSQVFA